MVELTAHQGSVGRVLRAGAALLSEGNLSEEEDTEVREQMNLLNSRWEHLRVSSMERQSRSVATRNKCFIDSFSPSIEEGFMNINQ